jgi:hypothetical protein
MVGQACAQRLHHRVGVARLAHDGGRRRDDALHLQRAAVREVLVHRLQRARDRFGLQLPRFAEPLAQARDARLVGQYAPARARPLAHQQQHRVRTNVQHADAHQGKCT